MEGQLDVFHSGFFQNKWQQRYCCLLPSGALNIYKDEKRRDLKSSIILEQVTEYFVGNNGHRKSSAKYPSLAPYRKPEFLLGLRQRNDSRINWIHFKTRENYEKWIRAMADVLLKLGKGAGAIKIHKPTPGVRNLTATKLTRNSSEENLANIFNLLIWDCEGWGWGGNSGDHHHHCDQNHHHHDHHHNHHHCDHDDHKHHHDHDGNPDDHHGHHGHHNDHCWDNNGDVSTFRNETSHSNHHHHNSDTHHNASNHHHSSADQSTYLSSYDHGSSNADSGWSSGGGWDSGGGGGFDSGGFDSGGGGGDSGGGGD